MSGALRTLALTCCAAAACAAFAADAHEAPPPQRSVAQWLTRLQQAQDVPAYAGIFVVSSAAGGMSSARIWHVCEGGLPVERAEALTGAPRLTYRHGQRVAVFWPGKRLVRLQERETHLPFPARLPTLAGSGTAPDDYYEAQLEAPQRVAGFEADVLWLRPRDAWRYGYRIWSERHTGLIIQAQTLDAQGRVLEQGGFSELQLAAPATAAEMLRAMKGTEGWQVERTPRQSVDALTEGWRLHQQVPGFVPLNFYVRPHSHAAAMAQWIVSDGLATVSLFIEPPDGQPRTAAVGASSHGATHALSGSVQDAAGHAWRVTAVGEAPPHTLQALMQSLERVR